jgi:N-acetylneuraminate lyase
MSLKQGEPMKHTVGLIAAVHTPMREDGSLRLERAAEVVDRLEKWGVVGIFVCGSTGEGVSLTTAERKAAASAYAQAARGRLRVIVHVGHNSLSESRELAAHAQEIGADAAGSGPPNYFKCASVEVLARCCRAVADAAPGLPLYYYHIPGLTGVALRMSDFLRAAADLCPALVGMKYTHEDLCDFQRCVELADGRYDMLYGCDEMLLEALVVGCRGAVGSTYNYAAPIYTKLIAEFRRGNLDEARRLQARSCAMVEVLHRYPAISSGKSVMKLTGLDLGPTRLPLATLTADQEARLESDLRAIGFFDWIR